MIDASISLVDSNVILDIIGEDPIWRPWSVEALSGCAAPLVNPLIFAELCYLKPTPEEVERLLVELDLEYQELPKGALFLAAQAYKRYREREAPRHHLCPISSSEPTRQSSASPSSTGM